MEKIRKAMGVLSGLCILFAMLSVFGLIWSWFSMLWIKISLSLIAGSFVFGVFEHVYKRMSEKKKLNQLNDEV